MTIENNFGYFMPYKQNTEISALDVAAYIVNYLGEIPTTKLWWLVYMCQVWYLVWNNNQAPLFKEDLEACTNVIDTDIIYDYYKDKHIEEVINKKYTGEYYDD